MSRKPSLPKYRSIYDELARDIVTGRYKPGQKFPSEAALMKRFDVSRITAGRALRDLQQNGFVDRVAGSGTFVRGGGGGTRSALIFGLVIPNLGETEIFEPICQGIASSPDAAGHALLWGDCDVASHGRGKDIARRITGLCRQYVQSSVSGVFFAPLEMMADADAINRRVLRIFEEARIPVVLLDKRPESPSAARRCDLAGIDNHRAGYLATEHLIRAGARRIGFVSFEHQVSTVAMRRLGFRDALAAHRVRPAGEWNLPFPHNGVLQIRWKSGQFDAFVCSNDRVAGLLMHALLRLGLNIPDDVRIVGMDDVNYASLLPVPLTTIHQPCRDIGETALRLMIERIERPAMPVRNVLLDCTLVVRRSCGSVK